MLRISLLLCIGWLTCGCMLGPDYLRPQTQADGDDGYVYGAGVIEDANDVATTGRWWEHFSDPLTAELVEQALEKNMDLRAVAARVLQAEALLAQSRGRRLPEVDVSYAADRSERSFNSPFGRIGFESTTHATALSVRYVADVFGRLQRTEQAAQAEFWASHANRLALQHTVIAQVVRSRTLIATLQRQFATAKNNTRNWRTALEVIDRRYRQGLTGPLDVRQARENVARSEAAEPSIEQQLILAQHALDVLIGRRPGASDSLAQTLPELPDLSPLPGGLPAALLDRRPDVRQAELHLEAAIYRVGASMAQLYPDLTLSGSVGYQADKLSELFSSDSFVNNIMASLLQPVYRGGFLEAQVDQSRASVEELAATYAGVVLNAMREVEDALVKEQMLGRRLASLVTRLDEAQAAEQLARRRYLQGVERIITVLETERSRRIAEDALIIAKGRTWEARVDLILALGGDWEIPGEAPEWEEMPSNTSSAGQEALVANPIRTGKL